ncbi:hypothetical protein [Gordonia sp. KTR9]|uniref:hypothetical protein n=1 Tax=Gordonia sp. KTR9 TaxID=337191 RepID=UPI00027DDEBA|nr:hypothetical protein [Gordonia sp. KTR9]AFR50027.1 hypothetical protein KTR9_3392 [Gordonia sp. KTR9]
MGWSVIGRGEADNAASLPPFGVVRPCCLVASGDSNRVEVARSPLVRREHRMDQPVRKHIEDHGLVLATRETFDNPGFMYGATEVSVYVRPHARNAGAA